MSTTINLTTVPVSVPLLTGNQLMIVEHVGGDMVYYRSTSNVGPQTNDGVLLLAQTTQFYSGPVWFASSSTAQIIVTYVSSPISPATVATITAPSSTVLPHVYMPKPSGDTTGATDGAALAAILAALPAGGATIQFGAGVYFDNTLRTIPNYVSLAGVGGLSAAGNAATIVKFTGTGSYLSAQNTLGVQVRDMWLWASNAAFAGALIDLSASASLSRIERCLIYIGITTAGMGLYFDNSQEAVIYGCNIVGGQYGIQGIATAAHFFNGSTIIGNRIGGQGTASLIGLGQGNVTTGNIFERQGGQIGIAAGPSASNGNAIIGNYFGDAAGSNPDIQLFGNGTQISGNFIGGTATSKGIQFAGTSDGITIKGNRFDTHSIGVDKNAQTVTGIELGPNSYTAVATHHNFVAAGSPYVEA